MKNYVGIKSVKAIKMNLGDYNTHRDWTMPDNEDPTREGYLIEYPDGYQSWSPKESFEKANLQVSDKNSITSDNVNDFIVGVESVKWGDKTTVVHATLANGFIITESSSCVDLKNFDMKIGTDICLEKIKNKVWELLGFVLQCGVSGINR